MDRRLIFILMVFISHLVFACTNPPAEPNNAYILKTEKVVITGNDFSDELDHKRAAYPYNIDENPLEYNQMVIHLVKMLSEEIILLSAAVELGIRITDEELDTAVTQFKSDYPEDSFEQVLLKNAVSYPFWLQRFQKNMIIERLIDQELKSQISITSEEMVRFYNQLKENQKQGSDEPLTGGVNTEKELVERLKMQKTQDEYAVWMNTLAQKYPVQINNEVLKKFMIDNKKVKENNE